MGGLSRCCETALVAAVPHGAVGGPAGAAAFLMRCCWWSRGCQRRRPEKQRNPGPDRWDLPWFGLRAWRRVSRRQRLVPWGPRSLDLDLLWCGARPQAADQGRRSSWNCPTHACASAHSCWAPLRRSSRAWCHPGGTQQGPPGFAASQPPCWRAQRRTHRSSCLVAPGLPEFGEQSLSWSATAPATAAVSLESPQPCSMAFALPPPSRPPLETTAALQARKIRFELNRVVLPDGGGGTYGIIPPPRRLPGGGPCSTTAGW